MIGRLGASITQLLTEQITQHDDCVGEMLTRELSGSMCLLTQSSGVVFSFESGLGL